MRFAATLLALALSVSTARGADFLGPFEEGDTVFLSLTFCDQTDVAPSTTCPDGGAILPEDAVTSLRYSVIDLGSGHVLRALDVTPIVPDANPYVLAIPYTAQDMVGLCSDSGDPCAASVGCEDDDETCDVTVKGGENQDHVLELEYVWPSGQRRKRVILKVTNMATF